MTLVVAGGLGAWARSHDAARPSSRCAVLGLVPVVMVLATHPGGPVTRSFPLWSARPQARSPFARLATMADGATAARGIRPHRAGAPRRPRDETSSSGSGVTGAATLTAAALGSGWP